MAIGLPMQFQFRFSLRGANGKVSSVNLTSIVYSEGTNGANFEAALADQLEIKAALEAITDAEVANASITYVETDSLAVPTSGDIFEKAKVVVALTPSGKSHTLSVPAPVIGVFEGATGEARDRVDIGDADLQAYVAALAANCLVSDGEVIDTGFGSNGGIISGRRVY